MKRFILYELICKIKKGEILKIRGVEFINETENDPSTKYKDILIEKLRLYQGILIFIGFFTFIGILLFTPSITIADIGNLLLSIFGIIVIISAYLVSILIIIKDHRKMIRQLKK